MEALFIILIIILLSIGIGVFFNNLINPVDKRVSFKKIVIVGIFLGIVIGLFFYWQQIISF
ncbi:MULTISPECIES: hypothetical protein [Mammaliicoccus]|uniref:hypothetical protein n=1 Tax=Mammaliicoccus TaxID=2803850 RepID=UPI0005E676C7|nr:MULTISPECIES: hypothetical protein [Mammaliicoccus]CPQ84737.1 Uncharacterised protein [Staphylococcus aureus]MCE5042028.1 hypothetical protein [Mammaliicoccus sciuri]MDT0709457.1 hypothetical protein [Mammaliicoccus sciuri]MDT0756553.1 hypothetical protein [Mammaliicoccus sciuri]MEB6259614.1 hypothetical protein [Mammaliicoccus sciuri]